ncbi:MAG: uracil-DNA glycosylase [Actinomycetes bacterium]
MPADLLSHLPKQWHQIVDLKLLEEISAKLSGEYIPAAIDIFAALKLSPSDVKVVIVGQDPYPNPEHAMGLAFSVRESVSTLPASLKNIFTELESDLGIKPSNGDLSRWASQGVLLLNRALTVKPGEPASHSKIGWHEFTEAIISNVAKSGAIGVLWGNDAQTLAKYFSKDDLFTAPHPSPLSVYRGFYGSKPFSKVNNRLVEKGLTPIKW